MMMVDWIGLKPVISEDAQARRGRRGDHEFLCGLAEMPSRTEDPCFPNRPALWRLEMDRRGFVGRTAGIVAGASAGASLHGAAVGAQGPGALAALKPLPPVPPITDDERRARIENARRLMA
jgi:hypothetical protein